MSPFDWFQYPLYARVLAPPRMTYSNMHLLYNFVVLGFPFAISLSPFWAPLFLPTHNQTLQQSILNATNTTTTLKAWPAVPFQRTVYNDFDIKIVQLLSQTPLVYIWTIETALLNIYTDISFYRELNERLPSEIKFTYDSGDVEVTVEFSAAEGSRTIRYWQARKIVNALWDITSSYNEPRQIGRADLMVGSRVVGHLKMNFVPTIVGQRKPGGNVTTT